MIYMRQGEIIIAEERFWPEIENKYIKDNTLNG